MGNFEAFGCVISSHINVLFLKSVEGREIESSRQYILYYGGSKEKKINLPMYIFSFNRETQCPFLRPL